MLLFKERIMTQLHFKQMVQKRLNNRSVQIGSAQTSVQFATVHLCLSLHTKYRKTFKYVWDIISFGWFERKHRHCVEDYFVQIATLLIDCLLCIQVVVSVFIFFPKGKHSLFFQCTVI